MAEPSKFMEFASKIGKYATPALAVGAAGASGVALHKEHKANKFANALAQASYMTDVKHQQMIGENTRADMAFRNALVTALKQKQVL